MRAHICGIRIQKGRGKKSTRWKTNLLNEQFAEIQSFHLLCLILSVTMIHEMVATLREYFFFQSFHFALVFLQLP